MVPYFHFPSVDRTHTLNDTYFPSLVASNINPLRKSFMFWLHESLMDSGHEVSLEDLYALMDHIMYSKNKESELKSNELIDLILKSQFFEKEFKEFMKEKLERNGSSDSVHLSPHINNIKLWHRIKDAEVPLGVYNDETKYIYHKNFINELASQWKLGQMVRFLEWKGMDLNDQDGKGDIFLEIGYPISFGYSNFIVPHYRKMSPDVSDIDLSNLKKGALNGINNGLSVLLDAESFDYGLGFVDVSARYGVGFKVGVVHHLDSPSLESIGTKIDVGKC